MGLRSEILARIAGRLIGSGDFPGQQDATVEAKLNFEDGVDANEADVLWIDERTVASATNDDIDLKGSLADAMGGAVTPVDVVAIMVINKPKTPGAAANTTNLTIGLGTNPFVGFLGGTTPTLGPIRPGGVFLLAAPPEVGIGQPAAGASDILRIANSSGAAATYQIAVVGRSA